MANDEDRLRRLQEERVIVGSPTRAQLEVIRGLTPEEVEVIIALNRRLEEADRVSAMEEDYGDNYWTFIHF